ncbi:hypothetical protein [uncultured Roseibium sp.]|uniref:hypothetical protein n=1 Tax=uncultured Roseibium sp. TaxID=1936171 RepID=UPI00321736A1
MHIETIRNSNFVQPANRTGAEHPITRIAVDATLKAISLLASGYNDLRKSMKRRRAEAELLELSPELLKDVALSRDGRHGWVHNPHAWRKQA